jgi:hypothetical protein
MQIQRTNNQMTYKQTGLNTKQNQNPIHFGVIETITKTQHKPIGTPWLVPTKRVITQHVARIINPKKTFFNQEFVQDAIKENISTTKKLYSIEDAQRTINDVNYQITRNQEQLASLKPKNFKQYLEQIIRTSNEDVELKLKPSDDSKMVQIEMKKKNIGPILVPSEDLDETKVNKEMAEFISQNFKTNSKRMLLKANDGKNYSIEPYFNRWFRGIQIVPIETI